MCIVFQFASESSEHFKVFLEHKSYIYELYMIYRKIITDRVRSTRGGNVFSLCVSSHLGGRGTYLPDGGGGTYSQVWMVGGGYLPSQVRGGGGYLLSGLDGGGVPTFPGPRWGGVPTLRSGRGGYLPSQVQGGGVPTFRSGWGGYLPSQVWVGGVPTQGWMGGYLPR